MKGNGHNIPGNPIMFDLVDAGTVNAYREFAQMIVGVSYRTVINGNEGKIRSFAGLGEVKIRGVTRGGEKGSTKQVCSICPVG